MSESEEKFNDSERHILIVDDNQDTCKQVESILKRYLKSQMKNLDYIYFHQASNGAEALLQLGDLNKEAAQRTILFVDSKMPALSGLELRERMRNSQRPEMRTMPIIYMSGSDEPIPLDLHLQRIKKPVALNDIFKSFDRASDMLETRLEAEKRSDLFAERAAAKRLRQMQAAVEKDLSAENETLDAARKLKEQHNQAYNQKNYAERAREAYGWNQHDTYQENDQDYLDAYQRKTGSGRWTRERIEQYKREKGEKTQKNLPGF